MGGAEARAHALARAQVPRPQQPESGLTDRHVTLGETARPTMKTHSEAGEKFQKLVELMARLRAPGGCPWDREQTFDSIKPYTLEETYEVLDAIDRRDWDELRAELGDFMLQVLFYAQMAKEQKRFTINDVLDRL